MKYINFLSTTSNCPAPPPRPEEQEQEAENASSTSTTSNPQEEDVRKRKTKSEIARDEQFNKLLKIAQGEDHPVELALSAIGKQMIRSLADDEQDELLEELRSVFDRYFRERRKRLRAERAASTTGNPKTTTPPPPPLTPAGQPLMNRGEILMDVTNMPPMQQFNAEYVHDVNGATYLQM